MASFNGERYIASQLESLINQDYQNWRLIIRDDFSTDNTLKIIRKFQLKDSRIFLINDNKGNLGLIKNFGEILHYSHAQYIMFCDQDDVWLPHKLSMTLEIMEKSENDNPDVPILVHTDAHVVDGNLKITCNSFHLDLNNKTDNTPSFYELAISNRIIGCTIMINSISKKYILPFNDNILMHDWWMGLIISHYGIIKYLDIPTILYRQHGLNQVGVKYINAKYYKIRFLNFSQVLRENYRYALMLKQMPFKFSIVRVFFNKILRSIISCQKSMNIKFRV